MRGSAPAGLVPGAVFLTVVEGLGPGPVVLPAPHRTLGFMQRLSHGLIRAPSRGCLPDVSAAVLALPLALLVDTNRIDSNA